MPVVKIIDKEFVPYITAGQIDERITAMAADINRDYQGKKLLIIGILNGSFVFAADLFRKLNIDVEISFIKLASYKGTSSTGHVVTAIGMEETLRDRHVMIVEDIIDTGRTLHSFMPEIISRQPESIKIATFLSKPEALMCPVTADYIAFEIENRFVVGYGLDYDGFGRNLPELYILKEQ